MGAGSVGCHSVKIGYLCGICEIIFNDGWNARLDIRVLFYDIPIPA
jgi:hypothetical protein